MNARPIVLVLAFFLTGLRAEAEAVSCKAEASFDWYTDPDIRLGDSFDPEAGPPVYEVELATGRYRVRFGHRTDAHRSGVMEILQHPDDARHLDFIGWDATNRHYMTIRGWVEGAPFMVADRYGDAFGGHCTYSR